MKRKITSNIVVLGLLLLAACGSSSTESSNRERNATITTVAGATTISNSSVPATTPCSTINGSVLTSCKPFTRYSVMWFDDTERLSPNMGASIETPITSLDFSKMNPSEGTTRVEVTIEFTDGSSLLRTKFPFVPIPDLTVKTTTTTKAPVTPQCVTTILASVLTTCKPFKEYDYSWHDDTKRLSSSTSSRFRDPQTRLFFTSPVAGAKRVEVRIVFTDSSRMEWALFRLGTTTKEPAIPPVATTTTTTSTSTTTTSTTTTIATVKSDCILTVQASVLTACAPIQSDTRVWWSDTKALSGTGGGSSVRAKTTEDYNGIGAPPGTTRVEITLDLVDGRKIAKLFIPYGNPEKVTINVQATSIPTTTLPALKISISSQGILSAGIRIKQISYSFWNDTKQLSGTTRTYGTPSYEARVSGSKDSTRIRITIEFTNGKSYTNIFIPYTYGKATSILVP